MKLKSLSILVMLAILSMTSCRNTEDDVYTPGPLDNPTRLLQRSSDTITVRDSLDLPNPRPPKPPIKGQHWR